MSEILFEFVQKGNVVKVTAIEPVTCVEVSVVVPASLSKEEMQFQALNRLRYILKKNDED